MTLPKKFIWFLIIAQIFLLYASWAVYTIFLSFFPSLAGHKMPSASLLALLALLPLSTSILDYKFDGPLLRWAYIASWVWLVYTLYLGMMATICLGVFLVWGGNLQNYGLLAIGFSAAIVIYGLINARLTKITKIKVKLPNLPESWRGKTAVLVTDIHLGHVLRNGFAKKVISKINSLKPEIVFIPGDFYDGVHTGFGELAAEFKDINAPAGVYFSSGNHEMFAGYGQTEAALSGAGIHILEDQKVEINGLQIAGLAYKEETDETVSQRIKLLGLNPDRPSILLKHVPDHLPPIARAGVSLQLSGHTHHGQIWPFRYITRKIFKGFDYGLKKLGNTQVYTSSGAGTWGPPVRIFTKSEIVQITFQ